MYEYVVTAAKLHKSSDWSLRKLIVQIYLCLKLETSVCMHACVRVCMCVCVRTCMWWAFQVLVSGHGACVAVRTTSGIGVLFPFFGKMCGTVNSRLADWWDPRDSPDSSSPHSGIAGLTDVPFWAQLCVASQDPNAGPYAFHCLFYAVQGILNVFVLVTDWRFKITKCSTFLFSPKVSPNLKLNQIQPTPIQQKQFIH